MNSFKHFSAPKSITPGMISKNFEFEPENWTSDRVHGQTDETKLRHIYLLCDIIDEIELCNNYEEGRMDRYIPNIISL